MFIYDLLVEFPLNEMSLKNRGTYSGSCTLFFLAVPFSLAQGTTAPEGIDYSLLEVHSLCVLQLLPQSDTHSSQCKIRGDDGLLWERTCGSVIRRFDRHCRRARSQYASCQKDSVKIFSGYRSILLKINLSICLCV